MKDFLNSKPEFLSFLYQVFQHHPEWASDAVRTIIDGSLNGYQRRVSTEASKRAAAETAVAMAYDNLRKGTPEETRDKIKHVLMNSFMFDGTPFVEQLKAKSIQEQETCPEPGANTADTQDTGK